MASSLTSSTLHFSMIILSSSLFLLCSNVAVGAGAKIHMKITNDLGGGIPLGIHCKSKDDDIGSHQLDYHQVLPWSFSPNCCAPVTLFWCHMKWKSATGWVDGSFEVYNEKDDVFLCQDECDWLWSIRDNGAYFFNPQTKQYQLRHPWW